MSTPTEDLGAHLADAGPSDTTPDPTLEDYALGRFARRFAAAAMAVEMHEGKRAGAAYQLKLEAWKTAYADLRTAAAAYPGEGT